MSQSISHSSSTETRLNSTETVSWVHSWSSVQSGQPPSGRGQEQDPGFSIPQVHQNLPHYPHRLEGGRVSLRWPSSAIFTCRFIVVCRFSFSFSSFTWNSWKFSGNACTGYVGYVTVRDRDCLKHLRHYWDVSRTLPKFGHAFCKQQTKIEGRKCVIPQQPALPPSLPHSSTEGRGCPRVSFIRLCMC